MATVISPNGEQRTVKNLAWLLRHAAKVKIIELSPQEDFEDPHDGFESRMIATLEDGTRYITDWASTEVCRNWIAKRKCFKKLVPLWGIHVDSWIAERAGSP